MAATSEPGAYPALALDALVLEQRPDLERVAGVLDWNAPHGANPDLDGDPAAGDDRTEDSDR